MFRITASVVLWIYLGQYSTHRVEGELSRIDESSWAASSRLIPSLHSPNRFGTRRRGITGGQFEQVRVMGCDWRLSV